MLRWMRFTMEHPWLSAAVLALLPALFFGLIAQSEEGLGVGVVVGVIFWALFFVVGGIVQTRQARRSGESWEQDEVLSPNPVFIWIRAHPWISAAVGALVLAGGTFARLVASGGEVARSLLDGALLGAGLLGFAVVRQAFVKLRGRSAPR